ncbi:Ig-like domain-containing protein [Nocardioides sp. C4-1]|uniref:Ig-like domain-containing protein n=1 Tax=Nocardioides sp. C4-1 TaxID=3151851 RepID=UPI0032663106
MPTHRRLTAALVAACLGWSLLVVGLVTATAPAARAAEPHDPATYYAGTDGLTAQPLIDRLRVIVSGNTALSYSALWTALPKTDPDPQGRPAYLRDFYSGAPILVSAQCGGSCPATSWNREHTWAQSHGEFGTSAGPGTDLHHMRPSFPRSNSSRGNKDFDNGGTLGVPECAACRSDGDSFEPPDAVKGDLARGLMYMAVRYPGFQLNDVTCNGSGAPNHGKLSTLVAWAQADPPDAWERARNDLIDGTYQGNRNPFIDRPDFVNRIWGTGVGQGRACGSSSGGVPPSGPVGTENRPPTTSPMTLTTPEDTSRAIPLVASDPDGDLLTWTISATPAHGTAGIAGTTLTYVPAPDFHGSDVVGVQVSDGRGRTASTTVTVTVTPVNDPPVAADVRTATARDAGVDVRLLGADVDGDVLTYAVVTPPAHGSAVVTGDVARYTPAPGYTGPDSFSYVARDPAGATSAPATVSITVTATQRPPVATAVRARTPEDLAVTMTLTATDADGDDLTYAVVAQPDHGDVALEGTRATYTPDPDFHGSDAFTWSVSDGTTTVQSLASITVTPVNDRPIATPVTVTTPEDASVTFTLPATDVDGDVLTYAVAGTPRNGTAVIDGPTATFTPDSRRDGSFNWTVSDGTAIVSSTATITVTPVDHPPVTTSVTTSTPRTVRGTPTTTTIRAAAVDGRVPTGRVTLVTVGRTLGAAVLRADGTAVVAWTPTRAGATALAASYSGDGVYAPAVSAVASTAVARSTSRLTLSAGALRRGRPGVVRVAVTTVSGVPATGRLTVRVAGKARTVVLVRGVARVQVSRLPRAARLQVTARYAGDAQYASGSAARALRIRR